MGVIVKLFELSALMKFNDVGETVKLAAALTKVKDRITVNKSGNIVFDFIFVIILEL